MAMLSVTFGKELSPQITDIYWEALKPLAIEQLQEGANSWIRHGKHFPKPADLLERFQEMDRAKPKPPPAPVPDMSKWLCIVNGLFLKYITQRRVIDGFKGDIDIAARRVECLSLAAWFEGLEGEDAAEATPAALKVAFDKAMARIPDKSASDDWLTMQLALLKARHAA